jgi:hypothetical protein
MSAAGDSYRRSVNCPAPQRHVIRITAADLPQIKRAEPLSRIQPHMAWALLLIARTVISHGATCY